MITVALLTGRGGSSLKDKNIIPVLGKPLLYYPAAAAKQSSNIDEFFVSSDDEKILNISNNLGYQKIDRPKELASPSAQHGDVIIHALDHMNNQDVFPDILVVLLANSPYIKTLWIDDCIKILSDDNSLSSVSPVYMENDHHPYRAKTTDEDGLLKPFVDNLNAIVSTNRQDLSSCYFFCHNFWTLRIPLTTLSDGGQPPWAFMGAKIKPYVVEKGLDIHTRDDIFLAERYLKSQTF